MINTWNNLDEIEDLKARVHNLTLYLRYIERNDPGMWYVLMQLYDGMPGYASGEIEDA